MALGKGLQSLIPPTKSKKKSRSQTSSGPAENSKDKIWHIPISELVPNSEQPRKTFGHDEMEGLVMSIKEHGILQPLTVTEKEDGGYELIAGERRLRASQIAGLSTVPALVRSATQQNKLELALIENIQRENLNPIEEAFSYKRLHEEFSLSHDEIAQKVGKSRPVVSNAIRLLDLPEEIQKALIDGKINVGKARALVSLKSTKDQLSMFKSMIGKGMTSAEVEREVYHNQPASSRKGSTRRDPNIRAQEMLLEDRLGTKVEITQKGAKGRITIHYHSSDELKRLIEELS